jgi:hypothetical protein
MKGRLYQPTINPQTLTHWRSHEDLMPKSQSPVQYIWPTSIPESWKKILHRKKIPMLHISPNSRSTLEFLEETQKYIGRICKPVTFQEETKLPVLYPTGRDPYLRSNAMSPNLDISSHKLSKQTTSIKEFKKKPGFKKNTLILLKKKVKKRTKKIEEASVFRYTSAETPIGMRKINKELIF